jgi:hypothetical protein
MRFIAKLLGMLCLLIPVMHLYIAYARNARYDWTAAFLPVLFGVLCLAYGFRGQGGLRRIAPGLAGKDWRGRPLRKDKSSN